MHPSLLSLDQLEQQCRWGFSRASGPGGQHRNKVETAASIEHLASGIRATATEERSQHRNRQVAMQRLRLALAVEYRWALPFRESAVPSGELRGEDPEPGAQGASELWRQYCRSGRIRVSRENEHFPALLAEAFEVLSALDYNLAETAKYFETSATQLVRFFASYAPALTKLNEHLVARGRSPRAAN